MDYIKGVNLDSNIDQILISEEEYPTESELIGNQIELPNQNDYVPPPPPPVFEHPYLPVQEEIIIPTSEESNSSQVQQEIIIPTSEQIISSEESNTLQVQQEIIIPNSEISSQDDPYNDLYKKKDRFNKGENPVEQKPIDQHQPQPQVYNNVKPVFKSSNDDDKCEECCNCFGRVCEKCFAEILAQCFAQLCIAICQGILTGIFK